MKRLSWKYVAGLIDGEGCINCGYRKKDVFLSQGKHSGPTKQVLYLQIKIEVTLTESCKHVLDLLENNYGGKLYYTGNRGNENWKPTWCWRLQDKTRCRALMQNIMNHCLIKQEQMRLAIWCFDNIKSQITNEQADVIKREFKLLKVDPHRLSEEAAKQITRMLQSSGQ